jgi:hypothetical protein
MVDETRLLVRLEASANKLVSEMKRASDVTRARMKDIDDQFANSNRKVTDGLGRAAKSYRDVATSSGAMRAGIQNTAYQVGDFAVQVAGGTAASRALAQQLPQLLGGLGVVGAVMGAVAAIAIPLGANFLTAADGLKKIDAISLDQVRGRISELKDLQKQYNTLILESGNSQDAATQQKLAALDLEYQAKVKLFEFEVATLELRKNQLEQTLASQLAAVEEMRKALTMTGDPDQANADYVRTRAQSEQLALVSRMVEENKGLFLEIKKQSAELDLVNLSLSSAQGLISGATSLAQGLAGAFGDAAVEAGKVGAALLLLRQQQLADSGKVYSGRGEDPRKFMEGGALSNANVKSNTFGSSTYTPKVKRGGGGGKGGKTDPRDFLQQRLDTAQAAAEMAKVEASAIMLGSQAAAEARAKIELLNTAKAKKLDLDSKSAKTGLTLRAEIDKQAKAIGALTVETERYREKTQFMTSANEELKNGFLDAIVEGKNLGGVLEGLAKKIARAALEAALFGSGPFAGGDGSGLLGGLFSGIFGGFRAGGGSVNAGQAYVVGERQPELFVPSTSGTIIPQVPTGAGGASQVQIMLSAGLEAAILRKAQGQTIQIVQGAAAMQQQALPSTVESYQARGAV